MKLRIAHSFEKDFKKLRNPKLEKKVQASITEAQQASSLADISQLKKLSGHDHFYRIRVGEHRIGVLLDGDTLIFLRLMDRKELYRHFPPV